MPATKTTRPKGKPSRKRKPSRGSSSEFCCPNPGKAVDLEAIIRRMRKNPAFARFIRDLLCDSYGDSAKAEAARKCLNSYYKLTGDDLTALCIPKEYFTSSPGCTVPTKNLLIAVPAEVLARRRRH
jgi:hypothetical protein